MFTFGEIPLTPVNVTPCFFSWSFLTSWPPYLHPGHLVSTQLPASEQPVHSRPSWAAVSGWAASPGARAFLSESSVPLPSSLSRRAAICSFLFLRAHVSLQLVPTGHCAIWQADCGTKPEIPFVCLFSLGILSLWYYSGSSGKNSSKCIWFAEWFSSVASVSESSMRDLSPISKSDGYSLMSLSSDG